MFISFVYRILFLMLMRCCVANGYAIENPSAFVKNPRHVKNPKLKPFILLHHPNYDAGMFSIFNTVIGFLQMYEEGYYGGVSVDFKNNGLYYTEAMGLNWWQYYCEPLKVGKRGRRSITIPSTSQCQFCALHTERELSKEHINLLINRYITFKAFIVNNVEQMVETLFDASFILGVHYRGTDKHTEAPRVDYTDMCQHIIECLAENEADDFLIYVATDEQAFLDTAIEAFPGKVIFQETLRTKDGAPLHFFNDNPYSQGYSALVDAMMLSKCDALVRTSSNLSLWSTYLNPDIPVLLVNDRYND